MNSKQLHYAIKLSKTLNFSQVAEQLNISQPALSKQILALENELGVKLFDRSNSPMKLTPAGMHFIQEAQELLYREEQLIRCMERYQSGEAGQLTIGITPFRSSYLIPEIVKKVRDAYPGIQVKLHEAGSDLLRRDAAEGKFDFSIVNLPVDESVLAVLPLEADRLVLVVPKSMAASLPAPGECNQLDFKDCKMLPFVVVSKNQEMRQLFDKLCAAEDFQPNIAAEVVSLTTAWTMARAGVAATILPVQFVGYESDNTQVSVYDIKNPVYTRQPVIVYRRGQYLSDAAKYAISILTGER